MPLACWSPRRRRARFGLAAWLLALLAACAAPTPGLPALTVAPTPTLTSAPNTTATAHAVEIAEGLVATLTAVAQTATVDAQSSATAARVAGTQTAQAGQTATHAAQATEAAGRRATATAAAQATQARATAQAQPLAARVEQLVADGQLSRGAGSYDRLDDFSDAWAQINWYQWLWTGYAPTDFVVRADLAWASASNTANWFNSGCGFVFREASREDRDHYLVYLGLDGVVYFLRARLGVLSELASAGAGRLDVPDGSAQFMLAVEGDRFTAYVNDQRVLTAHDASLKSGLLNYTLLSGTNRDFGTRCEMTNVELWTLDAP